MRIAVINEISSCHRNADILAALDGRGHKIYNLGMTAPTQTPSLTYLHTGLMSAVVLELGLADLVIGGCGTGQGYLNAAIQYPGVFCVLASEPLDIWLARRINAPNCVSLALNKGYGWASDVNLRLIFDALLAPVEAIGYPESRAESQADSRAKLKQISRLSHHTMVEILENLDEGLVAPLLSCQSLWQLLPAAPTSELKTWLCQRKASGGCL